MTFILQVLLVQMIHHSMPSHLSYIPYPRLCRIHMNAFSLFNMLIKMPSSVINLPEPSHRFSLNLKILSGKLATFPYRLTILRLQRQPNPKSETCNRGPQKRRATHPVQHKRNWYERNRQEPQRRTRPRNPQILIHGRREQRESSAETAPHEVVAREHAGRILRVCVG